MWYMQVTNAQHKYHALLACPFRLIRCVYYADAAQKLQRESEYVSVLAVSPHRCAALLRWQSYHALGGTYEQSVLAVLCVCVCVSVRRRCL